MGAVSVGAVSVGASQSGTQAASCRLVRVRLRIIHGYDEASAGVRYGGDARAAERGRRDDVRLDDYHVSSSACCDWMLGRVGRVGLAGRMGRPSRYSAIFDTMTKRHDDRKDILTATKSHDGAMLAALRDGHVKLFEP